MELKFIVTIIFKKVFTVFFLHLSQLYSAHGGAGLHLQDFLLSDFYSEFHDCAENFSLGSKAAKSLSYMPWVSGCFQKGP